MTDKPLRDLRVIEMGELLPGPFCGQQLGDFDADITKIEPPGNGGPVRPWGREKPHGRSLWWPILARNKKSITLNLRTRRGQEPARELIATATPSAELPGAPEICRTNEARLRLAAHRRRTPGIAAAYRPIANRRLVFGRWS